MLIYQWIIIIVAAIVGIFFTIWAFLDDEPRVSIIVLLVAIIVIGALIFLFRWYNTSTASGLRAVKDQQTELNNGLDRTIVVTAENGREIYRYDGKCDIETNNENYILFEDANHKRVVIYKGVQDTIIVQEK